MLQQRKATSNKKNTHKRCCEPQKAVIKYRFDERPVNVHHHNAILDDCIASTNPIHYKFNVDLLSLTEFDCIPLFLLGLRKQSIRTKKKLAF